MLDIKKELDGAVMVLTLNRPARRNALGDETVAALKAALLLAETDSAVRVTVIHGAAPGFCAGSDLKELAGMDLAGMAAHEAETGAVCRAIAQSSKPVVAAVEGFALGGGFVLAASCDVVVTGKRCRWHLPEVRIGWIPPWGLEAVASRVGPVVARRLTWGGEELDGHEAYRLGLADYLSEDGGALTQALAVAARLAALPAPAVAATKQYFAAHVVHGAEVADGYANRMFIANCKEPVAMETLARFRASVRAD